MSKEYDDTCNNEGFELPISDDTNLPSNTQDMSGNDIKDLLIQNILLLSQTSMAMGTKVDQIGDDLGALTGHVDVLEQRIESNRMEHWQEAKIYEAVHERVIELLGPKESANNKRYSSYLFPCFWGSLNARFNVSTYKDIRQADFEKALEFAETWVPNGGIHEFMYDVDRRR